MVLLQCCLGLHWSRSGAPEFKDKRLERGLNTKITPQLQLEKLSKIEVEEEDVVKWF